MKRWIENREEAYSGSLPIASHSSLWIQLHHAARVSFAAVTEVEGRRTAQVAGVAAMNVNVLPLVVALMPNARLLRLMGVSVALSEKIDGTNRFT